jgi:hypothetical protein
MRGTSLRLWEGRGLRLDARNPRPSKTLGVPPDRLYNLCERKKWADEALAYNGLVIAWPELTKLALAERTKARETQKDLDF